MTKNLSIKKFFYKFASFTTPGDVYYFKFDEKVDIQKQEPEVNDIILLYA